MRPRSASSAPRCDPSVVKPGPVAGVRISNISTVRLTGSMTARTSNLLTCPVVTSAGPVASTLPSARLSMQVNSIA
ncbi:MAG: hypothetical protein U1F37_19035 [Alphaproteobacteria bacterium]